MANPIDLIPVSRTEFAAELVPCLALTSGIGMTPEDQRTWLNAAYKALAGIPIALLKRGAEAAMRKADHPSKIVPAITKEIEDSWDRRKRIAGITPPAPFEPLPAETDDERMERIEVAGLLGALAERLSANA